MWDEIQAQSKYEMLEGCCKSDVEVPVFCFSHTDTSMKSRSYFNIMSFYNLYIFYHRRRKVVLLSYMMSRGDH